MFVKAGWFLFVFYSYFFFFIIIFFWGGMRIDPRVPAVNCYRSD